ncbi:MAG: NAD-dependent epimerase/dehydratase family protein [Bacteroidetes bacterium]|nr:NAD-dependent epimerase/dehydratase family protein [Bacteroidota bacterium]
MKKVLVTGATGFVGNYVINELMKHDISIIATSSNKEKAKQQPWFHSVKYIPFDITQVLPSENYFYLFNEPDIVIHLAWAGLPNYKSEFHVVDNLNRHKLLLENLVHNGLSNLTVTGTCLEYGMQEGCLKEDLPSKPSVAYAIAKDNLRKYLESLQQQYSFSLKWLRLFYMFGKGQNINSLLSQLEAALLRGDEVFNMSGGQQVRDYLPISKVAENIVAIALQKNIEGVINCCSGKPVTVKDFVESYLSNTNKSIRLNLGYYPYPDYEPMEFWGGTEKLDKALT